MRGLVLGCKIIQAQVVVKGPVDFLVIAMHAAKSVPVWTVISSITSWPIAPRVIVSVLAHRPTSHPLAGASMSAMTQLKSQSGYRSHIVDTHIRTDLHCTLSGGPL